MKKICALFLFMALIVSAAESSTATNDLIVIREQGSFSAGGVVIEVEGT